MINENTGEAPECPICGALKFWECGHLIADIDITFCEMHAGCLTSRESELKRLMEARLRAELESGRAMGFSDERLDQHWRDTVENNQRGLYPPEVLGGFFYSWLIMRLLDAGAIDADGLIIDEGPPGFSSQMRLLFSDDPERSIDTVLEKAQQEFG